MVLFFISKRLITVHLQHDTHWRIQYAHDIT